MRKLLNFVGILLAIVPLFANENSVSMNTTSTIANQHAEIAKINIPPHQVQPKSEVHEVKPAIKEVPKKEVPKKEVSKKEVPKKEVPKKASSEIKKKLTKPAKIQKIKRSKKNEKAFKVKKNKYSRSIDTKSRVKREKKQSKAGLKKIHH